MRQIKEIIIHCSATPEGRDYTVADIDRWHRQRGFAQIGYHYVIYRDGSIHPGRPIEQAGAHCQGHNQHSIGICYIGGVAPVHHLNPDGTSETRLVARDTRTPEQKDSLRTLIRQLQEDFSYRGPRGELIQPTVHGHNEFSAKSCPCFDVATEYATS